MFHFYAKWHYRYGGIFSFIPPLFSFLFFNLYLIFLSVLRRCGGENDFDPRFERRREWRESVLRTKNEK